MNYIYLPNQAPALQKGVENSLNDIGGKNLNKSKLGEEDSKFNSQTPEAEPREIR